MLELVRALSKRPGGPTKTPPPNTSQGGVSRPPAGDLGALRVRLRDLVKSVNSESEQAMAEMRRPLLQEIVLWEFGSDFRQHPEFVPMLDTIERAFDADPRSLDRLARLIRDLRR